MNYIKKYIKVENLDIRKLWIPKIYSENSGLNSTFKSLYRFRGGKICEVRTEKFRMTPFPLYSLIVYVSPGWINRYTPKHMERWSTERKRSCAIYLERFGCRFVWKSRLEGRGAGGGKGGRNIRIRRDSSDTRGKSPVVHPLKCNPWKVQ